MAQLSDLPEEILEQIIGHFMPKSHLPTAYLARGVSKIFGRIIDYHLLARTPAKDHAGYCWSAQYVENFLEPRLATYVKLRATNPYGADPTLPGYVNELVDEVLRLDPLGPDSPTTRARYVEKVSRAVVYTRPEHLRDLLAKQPGMLNMYRYLALHSLPLMDSEFALHPTEVLAAGAAVGSFKAMKPCLKYCNNILDNSRPRMGTSVAAAAAAGQDEVLEFLLQSIRSVVAPEAAYNRLLEAVKVAIRARQPNTTALLIEFLQRNSSPWGSSHVLHDCWIEQASCVGNIDTLRVVLKFVLGPNSNNNRCVLDAVYQNACKVNHPNIVRYLLGETIFVARKLRTSSVAPIILAVQHGCLTIVKILLDQNIPISSEAIYAAIEETYSYLTRAKGSLYIEIAFLIINEMRRTMAPYDLTVYQVKYLRRTMQRILGGDAHDARRHRRTDMEYHDNAKATLRWLDGNEAWTCAWIEDK